MEHHEAIEMMASERYLLDELTPELRDAYEEHFFGCVECANDVRFGALFVEHAKEILPTMQTSQAPRRVGIEPVKPEKREWFTWLRPAVMAPVFASLLAIIGYQNLVVYPALQLAGNEPQVLPAPTILAGATRAGRVVVHADPSAGSTLTLPLPQNANFVSLKFELYDSKNKLVWTSTKPVAANEDTATIWLPGRVKPDTYTLSTNGVTASGEIVAIQQQAFDIQQ